MRRGTEAEAPPAAAGRVISTNSVLIAEDDAVSCALLQSCLQKWDLNVITARDGLYAWHELQKPDAPGLIIMDWMMPGFSGIELCRKIRAGTNSHYPYVLLLTSRDTTEDLVEALDAGADDYLTKPFNPNELRARLAVGRRILTLQNELLEKEEALNFQAQHDSLTQLWNRGVIMQFMEREIARARRSGVCMGVLLVDIDHFKNVNDTHGHPVGDSVLKEVARRLTSGVRPYDWVGRYGGEEFIVLLANSSAETVAICAERLRETMTARPVQANGLDLNITASVGATLFCGEPGVGIPELLESADAALYRAKHNGRNRVEIAWSEIIAAS
jgi:two-component system, cell cycle response regulator